MFVRQRCCRIARLILESAERIAFRRQTRRRAEMMTDASRASHYDDETDDDKSSRALSPRRRIVARKRAICCDDTFISRIFILVFQCFRFPAISAVRSVGENFPPRETIRARSISFGDHNRAIIANSGNPTRLSLTVLAFSPISIVVKQRFSGRDNK